MAIAFDAASEATAGTGNLSWTHTPSGTPRGAVVCVMQAGDSASDEVSGVTYGGVAMTETTGSPNLVDDGAGVDSGGVYAYFLGSDIPTGAQTVAVTVSGSSVKKAYALTVTAASDTSIQNTGTINVTGVTSSSSTLSLSGVTSFVVEGAYSGEDQVAQIAPPSGWTTRFEHDFGGQVAGLYTYDTVGSSDVSFGITTTDIEEHVVIAVALREGAAATGHPAIARLAGIPFIGGATPRIQIGWR